MLNLMVSIMGKRPVCCPYTHKYLHSLTVDLAVFYSLQISHCVHLSLFTFNIKLLLNCISEVVRGPLLLIFRQLLINLVTQADTLNTLCNSYLSSNKSNKFFSLTVVANIFFNNFSFFLRCFGLT